MHSVNFTRIYIIHIFAFCLQFPGITTPALSPEKASKTKDSGEGAIKIFFSEGWLTVLGKAVKNRDCEDWQIVSHDGSKFRFNSAGGLSSVPEPNQFPLTVEPIPEQQLLDELEILQMEQELLEETLRLEELEMLEVEETKSHLNSTIPASSDVAPSSCCLVAFCKSHLAYCSPDFL